MQEKKSQGGEEAKKTDIKSEKEARKTGTRWRERGKGAKEVGRQMLERREEIGERRQVLGEKKWGQGRQAAGLDFSRKLLEIFFLGNLGRRHKSSPSLCPQLMNQVNKTPN